MLETLRSAPPVYKEPPHSRLAVEGEQPISLRFLLDVVRRRWITLLVCVALAVALGTAYAFLTPAKFAASSTLLIDTRLAQLSQSEPGGASVVDQAAVESQIELLRSEKMLVAVIDKLKLLQQAEFGGDDTRNKDGSAVTPDVALRRAIAIMSANLWVSRVGRSYLVSVTYNSPDPIAAARIANEVAAAYIADQIDAKVQAAQDQNAWLDAQVSERRRRAALSYRNVQDFKASHDINPLRDLDAQQEIDRLAIEASRARAAAIAARANLDRETALTAELTPDAPLPVAALRTLQDPELDALVGREQDLPPTAPPAGDARQPAAGSAENAHADVRTKVRDHLAGLADRLRGSWLAATAKQQAADSALADLRLRDTRSRLVQERLRELETDAASSRSLYESYLNQLTHAAQQQPVPASDTRVISPATVPLYPSTPKKKLAILLASIAGTMVGALAMFALENLDTVIRTRDRLVVATGLPCLGVIPRTPWRRVRRPKSPIERLRSAFPTLTATGPRSTASDALRSLQLASFAETGAPGAPVVGVTSATVGEGKTTVALNLALSARRAHRVLLIDANLRDPRLSQLVLSDGLSSVAELSLRHAISIAENLDVLPVSPQDTIEGAELPDARLFGAVLVEARAHYDLVIVDLPAILPVSEVQAVIRWIDLVALVTRWGTTTTAQVERALERLSDDDRLFGAILNGVRTRAMRRFEGSSYDTFADRARA